jgi:hypothetical protein
MSKIDTHHIIAVNYYTTQLDNINNDIITKQIHEHGTPPNTTQVGEDGEKSHSYHEDTVLPRSKEIAQLEKSITDSVNSITGKNNKIDAIWALTLQKNQSVMAHTHKSNQHINHDEYWSIAYYPEAPEGSADLIFHATHSNTIDLSHRVTPRPGLLVIFPSYILHYTDRHMCEEPRTVISANLHPLQPDITHNADWSPYRNRPSVSNNTDMSDMYEEMKRKGWRFG